MEPDTFQLHPKIGDPVNSAAHSHAPAPHCTDATRPIQNDVDPTCGHLREGELVPVGSVSDRFARGFERDDLPAPPTCVLPTERDKFVRHAGTGSRDGSAVRLVRRFDGSVVEPPAGAPQARHLVQSVLRRSRDDSC